MLETWLHLAVVFQDEPVSTPGSVSIPISAPSLTGGCTKVEHFWAIRLLEKRPTCLLHRAAKMVLRKKPSTAH